MSRELVAKNRSVIANAISEATQKRVAEAIGGRAASYVSRFLTNEQNITFEELLQLMEVCDLVVVRNTDGHVVVPADKYRALVLFAKEYMANL